MFTNGGIRHRHSDVHPATGARDDRLAERPHRLNQLIVAARGEDPPGETPATQSPAAPTAAWCGNRAAEPTT
jgi:hypothetical protein